MEYSLVKISQKYSENQYFTLTNEDSKNLAA